MSIFKYTLPSGSEFVVDAPTGTTQAQADKIFYEQVASGAFVGYRIGDSLTSAETALTNFGLTRLQRGTAGVDDQTLLAVIQNLPIVESVPTLTSVPVVNPVSQADFITTKAGLGPRAIGPLSSTQVQTIMAQIAATVAQPADQITQAKGLGQFGFSALQLERAGCLKPGTVERYLGGPAVNTFSNPDNFVQVLNTPSVWTGCCGVFSAADLLGNPDKQNFIQQQLMRQSYAALVASGTIKPTTTSATQPATNTGQVYSANQDLVTTTAFTIVAGNLVDNRINNSNNRLSTDVFSSNETTVSSQVPGGDVTSLVSGAIRSASASARATAGVGQVTDVNSAITAANNITTAVNKDIGALVSASSKIGPAATEAWAKTKGALANPGAITDKLLAGAEGKATALATGAKAQADALVAQGKQAIDNIAKSAKNAVDFADTKVSGLVAGVKKAAAFSNTVDRSTVDTAVTRVIGSEKIPSPRYELPNIQSLGIQQDIAKAQEVLKTAQNTGQAIINQGQAIISQGQALAAQTQGQFNNLSTGAKRLLG